MDFSGLLCERNTMSIIHYGITDGANGRPIISGVVVHGDTVYISGVIARRQHLGDQVLATFTSVTERLHHLLSGLGPEVAKVECIYV
jgi:enamine deaminase RidA (YjgF/YER057c/UK114 family)